MDGFDVEEFTYLTKRFIACQETNCEDCIYSDECDADMQDGVSTSTRLANYLKMLLPGLEERSEASMIDLFDIIDGK